MIIMVYLTSATSAVFPLYSSSQPAASCILPSFSDRVSLHSSVLRFVVVLLVTAYLIPALEGRRSWESPGCHLVGHTRRVTIPGCVPFDVTTNACRGYCVSYAVPSPAQTLAFNRNLVITSKAECCAIVDTHEVNVRVACRDGHQQKTFKSARSCACSICRRAQ